MTRRKPTDAAVVTGGGSNPRRIVLEKTYTSYAILLDQDEFDALGDEARKSLASRMDMLVPSLDLLEFSDVTDEPYIYLRLPADVDNEQMHAAIQEILDDEITHALEARPISPGTRSR